MLRTKNALFTNQHYLGNQTLSTFSAAVKCPNLPTTITNGAVTGAQYTYNSKVTFTCSAGYYITGHAQTVVVRNLLCKLNGQWNNTTPTCSRMFRSSDEWRDACLSVACLIIDSHVRVIKIVHKHDKQFTWDGAHSLSPTHPLSRSLRHAHTHVLFFLSSLPLSPHLQKLNSELLHHVSMPLMLTFFEMLRTYNSARFNQSRSFFSAAMRCSNLPTTIPNGAVSGTQYTFNSIVTFTCSAGYHITGQPQTVVVRNLLCQLNRRWNSTIPTCLRMLKV